MTNSHFMKAIVEERVADLRGGASPRPEPRTAKRRRRRARSDKPIQALPVIRPDRS